MKRQVTMVVLVNTLREYRVPFFNELYRRLSELSSHLEIMITNSGEQSRFSLREGCKPLTPLIFAKPLSSRFLSMCKYDVIVCWGEGRVRFFASYLVSLFARRRLILYSEAWCYPRTILGYAMLSAMRIIVPRCSAVMVAGSKSRLFFERELRVRKDRLFVVPYASFLVPACYEGRDVKLLMSEYGLELENKRVVLYLGRIVEYKGLRYLIDAFGRLEKEMKDVFLLVVGEGESRHEMEGYCREIGVRNFRFIGYARARSLPVFYTLSSVFVFPAITMPTSGPCNEAWGLTLNEAMSLGMAVIATDAVGSAHDLIKDGITGLMVGQKDVDGLVKALKYLLSNDIARRKIGFLARKMVETGFTYEKQTDRFVDAVKTVLELDHDARAYKSKWESKKGRDANL